MIKTKTRKQDIVCKAEAGASIFKRGLEKALLKNRYLRKELMQVREP